MRNEYCTGGTQPLTKGNLMVPKNPWVEIQRLTAERDLLVKALREVPDPEEEGFCKNCSVVGQLPLVKEVVKDGSGSYDRYMFQHKDCWYAKVREALRLYEASDART